MKKRILTIVAALMMAITPAMAQVFITDEEAWEHVRAGGDEPSNINVIIPLENVEYDQYLPIGDGLLVLAGMGAAYLLSKRKKEQD
ncbi:MAG: hypothetical protein J6T22_05970 [Bacteroidales bacterium]|nr:hypothetical protein [Bacteroidales bacterium]